ncbi:hypothetical protein Z948_1092 [Sulfitobacter donghicola DSW-25 = KCTC 12864 = JCM 14565]|nr:hypothetical protein Z948_1092 [Sulfitobacter donghicola DSW-25 = KCTC 12864 = JCM 14565]
MISVLTQNCAQKSTCPVSFASFGISTSYDDVTGVTSAAHIEAGITFLFHAS